VRENEFSHKGIDRAVLINRAIIDSNEYRRKFDNATDNPIVNKTLYTSSKEILYDRSGTYYESMRWIDGETGKIIAAADYMGKSARLTGAKFEQRILYNDMKLKRQLAGHINIVTLHNHPNSTAPSVSDLNSVVKRGYAVGFTVSHDGRLYKYKATTETNSIVYDMIVSEYLDDKYDINTAQMLAYAKLSQNGNIYVEEILP
jgi:hypothetical protein